MIGTTYTDETARATKAPSGKRGRSRKDQATKRPLSAEERKLYEQIPEEVEYVRDPSFGRADTEQRLFGSCGDVVVPQWTYFPEVPEEVGSKPARPTRLTGEDEAVLFLRYNYARYRLALLVEARRSRASAARARETVGWFRRAMQARADLVQANMGLVLAMAKRSHFPHVEFGELVSEGNMALLRSVEKFDVSRGYKFSTYACRAILKAFSRLASKAGRYRRHFPVEFDPELERSDYDLRKHDIQREDSLDALREILARNRAGLTEVERTIIWERFAISSDSGMRTLAQVGQIVGLSNERVRQILNSALRKMRIALNEQYLAA
jgi:RNA polymerase primary sigma factor